MDTTQITASYDDGYKTGLNWPDALTYVPGGPFVYSGQNKILEEQSKAEHKAYMTGWHTGFLMKKTTGRINPMIGIDENVRYHRELATK